MSEATCKSPDDVNGSDKGRKERRRFQNRLNQRTWRKVIDDIVYSEPIPRLPLLERPSRLFAWDTPIATAIPGWWDLTFVFFQDDDGWIKWGVYKLGEDEDRIVAQPVVQSRQHSRMTACLHESNEDDNTQWELHLFYVDTHGVLADIICTISDVSEFPPSVTQWEFGTLKTMDLRPELLSSFSASCSRNGAIFGFENRDIVLVFERSFPGMPSHVFEVTRNVGQQEWTALPCLHQELEIMPRVHYLRSILMER